MEKDNLIQTKSFDFAELSVRVFRKLQKKKREFILSKQFLRSATSIGANVEEAIGAQSRRDFIAKLSISYKEARETRYWIRLLNKTDYLDNDDAKILITEIESILRILSKILTTTKKKSE
jgi:four helix bundle protein